MSADLFAMGEDFAKFLDHMSPGDRDRASEENLRKSEAQYGMHSHVVRVRTQHDMAIYEFRPHLAPGLLQDFDAAAERYRQCRRAVQPATLAAMASLGLGKPIDRSVTVHLKETLDALLAFADAT